MARPTRPMMISGAAVVLAALVGGGVTYAATDHSTPTASAPAVAAAPKAGHGKVAKGAKHAHGAGAVPLGQVEHGELTTASAGVLQVQRGAITAIDPGSLTVRSADGYTASYAIAPTTTVGAAGKARRAVPGTPDAAPAPGASAPGAAPTPTDVSQLHTGDTVQVMATKTDTGSTATRIAPTRA